MNKQKFSVNKDLSYLSGIFLQLRLLEKGLLVKLDSASGLKMVTQWQ